MARTKLIETKEDVAAEHYALFDALAALRGRISGPTSVTLHSPGLAGPWNAEGEHLHRESVVPERNSELAVCVAAREFDCGYIWAAHVGRARNAGVSDATIAAVASDAVVDGLPEADRIVIEYGRQLIRSRRVDQAVFDAMLAAQGERGLVELTAWIGRYSALSGILNSFEVVAAPDAEKLPERKSPPSEAAKAARAPLSSPRLTMITAPDQVDASALPDFEAVAEGRGNVRGPFAILMYCPPLAHRVLDLSTYLRKDSFLTAAQRELATIATARERDCPYVWSAHAPAARREGVDDAVVAIVRDRGEANGASDVDADIIEFTRELLRQHRVDGVRFERLLGALSLPGLVELVAVIGHYVFVTSILNAFEVAPAPDAEQLPL